jgi:threonine dehydratase
LCYTITNCFIDNLVTVSEGEIALAILRLAELGKSVVEGAAASTLAAMMSGKLSYLEGKRVVLLLCGGNIDTSMFCRVMERGLVADGRLCRCSAVISDREGGLAQFASLVAQGGASIKEIVHERAFATTPNSFASVEVHCVLETRSRQHIRDLSAAFLNNDIDIRFWDSEPGMTDKTSALT